MDALYCAAAIIIGAMVLYSFVRALLYLFAYLAVVIIGGLPLAFIGVGTLVGIEFGGCNGCLIIVASFVVSGASCFWWLRSKTFKKVYEKILPKRPADDIYKIDITKLNKPPQEKK